MHRGRSMSRREFSNRRSIRIIKLTAVAAVAAGALAGFPVYVVNEVNSGWGNAIPLPRIEALDKGLKSDVTSISCPSPGNCAVGGFYTDANGQAQAFVANQSAPAGARRAAPGNTTTHRSAPGLIRGPLS